MSSATRPTSPKLAPATEPPDHLSRSDEWDWLVTSLGGGLLQSWHWGEFKRLSGWEPKRHAQFTLSGGQVCAQVLYRAVPKLPIKITIAYMPRGPVYSDDTALGDQAFWDHIHAISRRKGAIFLKVEPPIALTETVTKAQVDKQMAALGFIPSGRLQPARTIVRDIDKPEDQLLAAMKPKTRYNLRLAGRRGVLVRPAQTRDDLLAFYSLLKVTGERDEFGLHTFPYYEQLWHTFGPDGNNTVQVLLAQHPDGANEEPIAGLLALRFGTEVVYMYGASANRGREHMPNYLLQWEAIKWAREYGCTLYDFWGIPDASADEDTDGESSPTNTRAGLRGVYWFKKGFGGREIEYPGAYDYVYNPLLYKLWMRWRGANLG